MKKLNLSNLNAFRIAALFASKETDECYNESQRGVLIGPATGGVGTMFYGTNGNALSVVMDSAITCDGWYLLRHKDIAKAANVSLEISNGVCSVTTNKGKVEVLANVFIGGFYPNVEMLLPPFKKFLKDFIDGKSKGLRDNNAKVEDGFDPKGETKDCDGVENRVPINPFYIDGKYYARFGKVSEILLKQKNRSEDRFAELVPLYKRYGHVYFTMAQKGSITTMFVIMDCRNSYLQSVVDAKVISDNISIDYDDADLN